MKLIDILVKIANGEEIPMFKYEGHRYKYNKDDHWFDDLDRCDYIKDVFIFTELNKEVEIIEDAPEEDKKIEKLSNVTIYGATISSLRNELQATNKRFESKLNEIIDKLNGD